MKGLWQRLLDRLRWVITPAEALGDWAIDTAAPDKGYSIQLDVQPLREVTDPAEGELDCRVTVRWSCHRCPATGASPEMGMANAVAAAHVNIHHGIFYS